MNQEGFCRANDFLSNPDNFPPANFSSDADTVVVTSMAIDGSRWLFHSVTGPGNLLYWVMLYSLKTEIIDKNSVDFPPRLLSEMTM